MSQTVWVNGESQEVVALVQNVEFIRKAIDNIFERIFVVVRVHSHLTSSIHERLQYLPYYNRNLYKIINTINEDVKCSNTRLVAQAASKHYLQHIYLSYGRWYLHHAPHSPISLYMVIICLLIVVLATRGFRSILPLPINVWRSCRVLSTQSIQKRKESPDNTQAINKRAIVVDVRWSS